MAVTVEYQAWDSASYDWLDNSTSTAAPQQINDKLSAWITAVNANASNTTKQITIEKGPADSTSTNYVGWVLKLDSASTSSPFYALFYSTSTTGGIFGCSDTWTGDGTNGGYGAASGLTSTSSFSYKTSGVAAEFTIGTETTDGEEFFVFGYKTDASTTFQGVWVIFKDSAGEWAYFNRFSSAAERGCYYMPTHTTPQRVFGVATRNIVSRSDSLSPFALGLSNSAQLPAAGNSYTAVSLPGSSYLYIADSAIAFSFNRYANMADGRVAISPGHGPIVITYLP